MNIRAVSDCPLFLPAVQPMSDRCPPAGSDPSVHLPDAAIQCSCGPVTRTASRARVSSLFTIESYWNALDRRTVPGSYTRISPFHGLQNCGVTLVCTGYRPIPITRFPHRAYSPQGRLLFLPSLQCLSSQNSQCIPLALTGCPSPPAHHCTAPAPSLRVSSQRRTCCPGILSGSHRSLCTEFRISIFQRTDRPFLHRD